MQSTSRSVSANQTDFGGHGVLLVAKPLRLVLRTQSRSGRGIKMHPQLALFENEKRSGTAETNDRFGKAINQVHGTALSAANSAVVKLRAKRNFVDATTRKNQQAYDARANEWQGAMNSNFGHRYLEKPAMIALLPETLVSKEVLCIGVGSGEELEEILRRNPNKVVGIDISTKLLEIAKPRFPRVEFLQMDMTQMTFGDDRFDFVYSSLTFHYAKDWDVLLAEVGKVLKKDGQLLFSTHHPIYWVGKTPTGTSYTNPRGITLSEHTAVLPGEVEITYYNHADESSIVEAVEHAGFQVKTAFAPSVVDASLVGFASSDVAAYEKLKAKNEKTPLFFVVSAVNNGERRRGV